MAPAAIRVLQRVRRCHAPLRQKHLPQIDACHASTNHGTDPLANIIERSRSTGRHAGSDAANHPVMSVRGGV